MATFTVVMRTLTKGHAISLKQCAIQTRHKPFSVNNAFFGGVGSHMFLTQRPLCFSSPSISPLSHLQQPAARRADLLSHSSSFRNHLRRYSSKRLIYNGATIPSSIFILRDSFNICKGKNLIRSNSSGQRNSPTAASDSGTPSTEEGDKPGAEQSARSDKDPKDSKKESWWRGKNSWRLGLLFLSGTFITWGIGLVNIWGAPQLDPDGNEIKDEFSEMPAVLAYLRRTWKEMNVFKKKIQDPSREVLLPDPLKYPYMQPPYTLVIELTGVLLHPDWTYNTGWRFKKRPGIDYFLQHVGPPLFEVVIYSQEAGMTADPLVNHLDPQGYIMYRLYRDATRYMEGKHVKDLSCLNREMSKIIMLDCNKDSVSLQPRNSLVLKKWVGEDEDRILIDLAHFLKTIATSGVEDIRPVLDYYNQFDDPLDAFKDNQRKLQEEEEARKQRGKDDKLQKRGWLSTFGVKR